MTWTSCAAFQPVARFSPPASSWTGVGFPGWRDDEEGHVVVGTGGGGPGGVHEHPGDGPGAVGFAVPVVLRDKGHLARLLAVQAVRRRDHQILDRTVHDARACRSASRGGRRLIVNRAPTAGGSVVEAGRAAGREGRSGPRGAAPWPPRRAGPRAAPQRVRSARWPRSATATAAGQDPAPGRRPGSAGTAGRARLSRPTADPSRHLASHPSAGVTANNQAPSPHCAGDGPAGP